MTNMNSWMIATILLALLSACSPDATPEAMQETEAGPTSTPGVATGFYHEAPQLAELVAADKLPPVEERLPQNPLVVQPVERVGVYGGVWRMGMRPTNDAAILERTVGYENLVRWDPQWIRVVPNIAQSVEVNEDATAYTFHLRPGMRWSDGAPFTADDILFWYEDIFLNEALTPTKPSWLVSGGEPVQVEKVNDSTVVFHFAAPHGLFLYNVASPGIGDLITDYPRHYLEQFHVKYNPEGIEALVQETGVADWVALFQMKRVDIANGTFNPELPTLHAWIMTNTVGEGVEQLVAERNPYYWKTDTAFNQLPYIDRVLFTIVQDTDELVEMAANGEIDMQDRHIGTPENRARFEANMEQHGYHFYDLIPSRSNRMVISLNHTHPDPILRQIFQNRDFRIGLSYAINRQEIIDRVFGGETEPYQVAPRRASPFYHERLATQYLEYAVERANEHLDRAGYSERDADGFRLGPDGERITFTVLTFSESNPTWVDVMALVQGYRQEVGVDIRVEDVPRQVRDEARNNNTLDGTVGWGSGGLDVLIEPAFYFPYTSSPDFVHSPYAPAWAYWYIDPEHPLAELPSEAAQRQIALYNQLKASGDSQEQNALMKQILDIAADEFYVIGINIASSEYGIVKNNFYNVPKVMPSSWTYPNPGPTNPEQYFLDPQE